MAFDYETFHADVGAAFLLLRTHGVEPTEIHMLRSTYVALRAELGVRGTHIPADEPLYLDGVPCIINEATLN